MKKTLLCFLFLFGMSLFDQLSAHPGIGIVMDSQGNVFYTDLVHVWKITPDGQHSIAVKDVHTHELYLDEEDNLYGEHVWYEGEATDKWGYYVWCLKREGTLEKVVGPKEGFPVDNTLQRDYEGSTYWPEKVEGGEVLKMKTTTGAVRLVTPHTFRDIRWIHIPKCTKDIYVVDYLSVKQISAEGKVTVIADNLKESGSIFSRVSDHHYLMGLWTDASANLFVAVYGAKKVKQFSRTGQVSTVYKAEKGWSPCGGLVGRDGSWWIMEFSSRNKTRVIHIARDGSKHYFAS